jgi:hypothetical protein
MQSTVLPKISADSLTEIFNTLKSIYEAENITPDRREYITSAVKKYGYLPYPHIKALEELTPAETIAGIEEKLKINSTFSDNGFCFDEDRISPVKRAGFTDASWSKTEQHNIKLVNLAGLGNGNISNETGKFIDWLKQLLVLPSGNLEKGVLSTTMYLIPFHPREFGCAYLPTSSDVSTNLCDKKIKENLGFSAKQQVQLFIMLTQLAGHPVMYDVLPQTGRFSKIVLTNPHVARWFNTKSLIEKLEQKTGIIAENLKQSHNSNEVNQAAELISNALRGNYQDIPEYLKEIAEKIDSELDKMRKIFSEEMLKKENQEIISHRAKQIINAKVGTEVQEEKDIHNHGEIIGELINSGLWPAPGGAWCSSGIPVFNKMSEGAGYPTFKHYDHENSDVTHFANLDCQTPYYFVYLESGEYNEKVIEFFINFLKKIRSDYNFDGFRIDHIDHIVDAFSETKEGIPISYRAPREVLGKLNKELKKEIPHFAALAEYMLWDNFFGEYHNDMAFDLLWGSDIVSQYQKTPERIAQDNAQLAEYNAALDSNTPKLSILKTYNNQDGEFRSIDQYPGQLGEDGALFKWFKFKSLPGGSQSQRPVLYIDGDESFTKTGIESVIGEEKSMLRGKNYEFYKKFDAINRFTLNNDLTRYGFSEIYLNDNETGFTSWMIRSENEDLERLLVVANRFAPTEKMPEEQKDGSSQTTVKEGKAVINAQLPLPDGFKLAAEYVFSNETDNFEEYELNMCCQKLCFEHLSPSEFKIFKITRV